MITSLADAIDLFRTRLIELGFDKPTQDFYIGKYRDIIVVTHPPVQAEENDSEPRYRDGQFHYDVAADQVWVYDERMDGHYPLGWRWVMQRRHPNENNVMLRYYKENHRKDKINNLLKS